MPKNFAIIGVGGYIAPRHVKAIKDTGNRLVAAVDPKDSVGMLDQHSYVSICSPNYLYDAHCRLALRAGTDAICEKPLVINPWNLDLLQELEQETGRRISTILQLRVHRKLLALREALSRESSGSQRDVCLTYVTARSPSTSTS